MEANPQAKAPSLNHNPAKEVKIHLNQKALQTLSPQSASYGFSQPISSFEDPKRGASAVKKRVVKSSKDADSKRVSKVIITSLLEPTTSQVKAKTQVKRKQVSKIGKISQQKKPTFTPHDQPRGSMTEAGGINSVYSSNNQATHYLRQPKLGASLRPVSLSDLSVGLLSGRSDHVRVPRNPKNAKEKYLHPSSSSQKLAVSLLRSSGGRFLTDYSRDSSLIRNLPLSEYSQKNLVLQKFPRQTIGALPQSVRVVSSAKNYKNSPKKRQKKAGEPNHVQPSTSIQKTVACADPELGRQKSPAIGLPQLASEYVGAPLQSCSKGAHFGADGPNLSLIGTSATKKAANSEAAKSKDTSPAYPDLHKLEAQLAQERRYFTAQLAAKDEHIRDLQAKLQRAAQPTVVRADC